MLRFVDGDRQWWRDAHDLLRQRSQQVDALASRFAEYAATPPPESREADPMAPGVGSRSDDWTTGDITVEVEAGFEELDALSVGAQGHYWFGERVKVGLTANSNDEGDADSGLEYTPDQILVSSGAIVSGIKKLQLKEYPKNLPVKQAAAAVGQPLRAG